MKKIIIALISVFAIILLLGAVGGLEQNCISFGRCFLYCAISFVMLAGARIFANWEN